MPVILVLATSVLGTLAGLTALFLGAGAGMAAMLWVGCGMVGLMAAMLPALRTAH
jgi:hypothetical protein